MPQMLRTVRVPEDVAPGTEIVVFQADEIVEEGIFEVEISLSTVFNKVYQPAGQRAKWFRDELGQLWVKFDSAPPSLSQDCHSARYTRFKGGRRSVQKARKSLLIPDFSTCSRAREAGRLRARDRVRACTRASKCRVERKDLDLRARVRARREGCQTGAGSARAARARARANPVYRTLVVPCLPVEGRTASGLREAPYVPRVHKEGP
jgi:hypothetical protein